MMDPKESQELQKLSQLTNKYLVLYPKKEYQENYKKHEKLYKFLCEKADEAYRNLLTKS
jgi:hypothetical protein